MLLKLRQNNKRSNKSVPIAVNSEAKQSTEIQIEEDQQEDEHSMEIEEEDLQRSPELPNPDMTHHSNTKSHNDAYRIRAHSNTHISFKESPSNPLKKRSISLYTKRPTSKNSSIGHKSIKWKPGRNGRSMLNWFVLTKKQITGDTHTRCHRMECHPGWKLCFFFLKKNITFCSQNSNAKKWSSKPFFSTR